MFRKTGFAATVLLAGVAFSTSAAAAITPLSGEYLNVGAAQVRVLPGSKYADVTITGTIGITGVAVSLPSPVRITNGSFSYLGKTIWRYAIPPVRAVQGTGTIRGTFTTAKNLMLSYNLRRNGASLTRSNVPLAFSPSRQTVMPPRSP
jgi:hypothetical protein